MRRTISAFLFCPVWTACLWAQTTLTVSPDGPLKSLTEARDAIRALRQSGKGGPVTVQVRGGIYFMSEPLVLTPEDSGSPQEPIVYQAYPGERPVFSGGRRIQGWQKGENNVWTAEVPGVKEGNWHFRQLFVRGARALRSRIPNNGFYRIEGPSPHPKEGRFKLKFRGEDIRKAWEGTEAEVVALLAWAEIRMPIVSVDPAGRIALLAGMPRPSNREADARYWIENTPEGVDSPGEWYLDRASGILRYRPRAGEDVPNEEVVAPALTQVVRLEGKPEEGRLIRNITFRGLEFRHTDWTLPKEGYADTQAAFAAGAAFEAIGAEDITLDRCTFTQMGSYGVWFSRGSKRNRVQRCHIYDMGAGGIKLGETEQRQSEADRNFENLVTDNHVHHLGVVYPAAIGIWVAQSSRNTISHNHIHDLYYTAISVGWTWGYTANQSKGNLLEFNHLHHIGKDMLSDMGAIYTLGEQPGTVIRNNLIHDVWSFTYGGWGIYPDEGSSEMLIEDNVVYRTKSAGFHQHYGRNNLVRNNVFAFGSEYQVMRTRAEPHLSFKFVNNIVYFDQGQLLGSNWTGENFELGRNVYFDVRGGEMRMAGKSFREWQQGGRDLGSVVADPLFVNAGNYDFRLRPESPALKMGFKPIDLSRVGPRP
ncbi:MAG: right-handed parallel beta-helix repeat-containing protein [Bryobacterales bacterium]|nr:right-handed parallel beta-helix repeat-containing protein [Bryobacterales bacterium]